MSAPYSFAAGKCGEAGRKDRSPGMPNIMGDRISYSLLGRPTADLSLPIFPQIVQIITMGNFVPAIPSPPPKKFSKIPKIDRKFRE